jgi:elongation factor Ts
MDGGKVGEKIVEYVGIIGEKVDLSYFEKIEAPHVQAYIHPGTDSLTLVGFTKSGADSGL